MRKALETREWFGTLGLLDQKAAMRDFKKALRAAVDETERVYIDLCFAGALGDDVKERCVTAGVAAMMEES